MPVCDLCNKEMIKEGRTWSCPVCDSAECQPYPFGLEPSNLPVYIAYPWQNFWENTDHPRIKLDWLITTAEVCVMWSVSVALAEVLQANNNQLPLPIVRQVSEHIERPTLGRWLGILRSLSENRPQNPALAPKIFGLYKEPMQRLFAKDVSDQNSLLELRNRLAHGGGISHMVAEEYLCSHEQNIIALVKAVVDATAQSGLIFLEENCALSLLGVNSVPTTVPQCLHGKTAGPWLFQADNALSLQPLTIYSTVHKISSGMQPLASASPIPQLYNRSDKKKLYYVPLALNETRSESLAVEAFRALFSLDWAPEILSKSDAGSWDIFLKDASHDAHALVGRVDEIEQIKKWLKGRDTRQKAIKRIGWIQGEPGIGKSLLMAKIAADFPASSKVQQTFYFRFRRGDSNNSVRAFLGFLSDCLCQWRPLAEAKTLQKRSEVDETGPEDEIRILVQAIDGLPAPNIKGPKPRFLAIIDGLDEVLVNDSSIHSLILKFALPGTVWLLAGRNECDFEDRYGCHGEPIFDSQNLSPMADNDIRAMLMNSNSGIRLQLLKRDEEVGDSVNNPFIEKVIQKTQGLPIYAKMVLEDLESGEITARDEHRLPDGLQSYYLEIIRRYQVSDIGQYLTRIVSILARAEEPVDEEGLAQLLSREIDEWQELKSIVSSALNAGMSMFRLSITPEGTWGYSLFHQSFREFIAGNPDKNVLPVEIVAWSVREAEQELYGKAGCWESLPEGNLRNHLFRWGNIYALRWHRQHGIHEAYNRLTGYTYLHERLKALGADSIFNLLNEFNEVLGSLVNNNQKNDLGIWHSFFRERSHIFKCGDEKWPVYKILLQLAIEHAGDSPLTIGAEQFLAAGRCDWAWLRREWRVARTYGNPCLAVLDGHSSEIRGARFLPKPDGRILSWSNDKTLRLWDGQSGECLAILEGHTANIMGATTLPNGRILFWTGASTLHLWEGQSGIYPRTLVGHTGMVVGVLVTPNNDGRILSWSEDKTLRIWDSQSGACLLTFEGHEAGVNGALLLPDLDNRILSWSEDNSLRLWDGRNGKSLATLEGHTASIIGASFIPSKGGQILSWSEDKTVRLWDASSGKCLTTLKGCPIPVIGEFRFYTGELISWSEGNTPFLGSDGQTLDWKGDCTLSLSRKRIIESIEASSKLTSDAMKEKYLTNDPNFSIGKYITAQLQDRKPDGLIDEHLTILEGHISNVNGALLLPDSDGRLLSWSKDKTLRLWNRQNGECLATLEGHTASVKGALVSDGGQILSWSEDKTLRIWNGHIIANETSLKEHTNFYLRDILLVPGDYDRILSWSYCDNFLCLWDGRNGEYLLRLEGHTDTVIGALPLSGNRILSWSGDKTLRLWDCQHGKCLAELVGHTSAVGDAILLSDLDDRILTWSDCLHYDYDDHTLRLWDGQNGKSIAVLEGHTDKIKGALAIPNSGGRILSWSADHSLRLWDGQSGKCIAVLAGHSLPVKSALPLIKGRLLTSCDGTLYLWDFQNGECLMTLKGHSEYVNGVLSLPERDNQILSWSEDNTLRLWDFQSGECLATLEGHSEGVNGVLLLPESDNRILSWSDDNTLRLWDGQSGKCIAIMEGHTARVEHALLLPEGQILSWSDDTTMRKWDAQSGKCLATLAGQAAGVKGASPLSGGRILSWSWDKTLQEWSDSGELLRTFAGTSIFTVPKDMWQAFLDVNTLSKTAGLDANGTTAILGFQLAGTLNYLVWHGVDKCCSRYLFGDGRALVTQANGQVCLLSTYFGSRRVTLEELQLF